MSTGGEQIITPEALSWIGKVYPPAYADVSATDIAKYAVTMGETAREYFDEDAAKAAGFRAIVAPLGYYVAVRLGSTMVLPRSAILEDGTPDDDFPPVRATQVMAGETDVTFTGRIHAGDRIRVEKSLVDLTEKVGSSGRLGLMKFRYRLFNQLEEELLVEDYTRILR
ncbi:MAG TPA: MaoC family dehydratase N-terminal domain-containing protein [Pseudonocardia sp.]|jgi:acyl dehydratase|nr:MaoC family dehydratase N-terminal domain-containing protein [Pseudonocardia sp.]